MAAAKTCIVSYSVDKSCVNVWLIITAFELITLSKFVATLCTGCKCKCKYVRRSVCLSPTIEQLCEIFVFFSQKYAGRVRNIQPKIVIDEAADIEDSDRPNSVVLGDDDHVTIEDEKSRDEPTVYHKSPTLSSKGHRRSYSDAHVTYSLGKRQKLRAKMADKMAKVQRETDELKNGQFSGIWNNDIWWISVKINGLQYIGPFQPLIYVCGCNNIGLHFATSQQFSDQAVARYVYKLQANGLGPTACHFVSVASALQWHYWTKEISFIPHSGFIGTTCGWSLLTCHVDCWMIMKVIKTENVVIQFSVHTTYYILFKLLFFKRKHKPDHLQCPTSF